MTNKDFFKRVGCVVIALLGFILLGIIGMFILAYLYTL